MVVLKIPDQDIKVLMKIQSLKPGEVSRLSRALSEAPPVINADQLTKFLNTRLGDFSALDIGEVVRLLIAMSNTRFRMDCSLSDLVDHVFQALEQSDKQEFRINPKARKTFKNRLIHLLNYDSLLFPVKASNVMLDHDRVYVAGRTLTDIRAIFGSDTSKPIKAAVIIHTLNLTVRRNSQDENIYVAMDSNDVKALIATLQRTITKAEALKKSLDGSKIDCLSEE